MFLLPAGQPSLAQTGRVVMLQTMSTPPRTFRCLLRDRIHAAKVVRVLAQATAQETRPLGNVRLLTPITRPALVTIPLAAAVH